MAVPTNVSKGRSPRYPRISVLNAVSYARRLYEGAHRSEMDSDTAYRVMGFAGKNGASATVLGAVRQFGLVDGLRGNLKVSDVAMRLLEPSSRAEYVEALHEAAYNPDVFGALFNQFPEGIPKSDDPIRSFLIRMLDFSRSGADECIGSFRETLSELDSESDQAIRKDVAEITQALPEPLHIERPVPPVQPIQARELSPTEEFVRIPLTRECMAELRFSGPVCEEAIARLIKYIELMKDVWADR